MPLILLDVWIHSSLSIFTPSAKFRLDFFLARCMQKWNEYFPNTYRWMFCMFHDHDSHVSPPSSQQGSTRWSTKLEKKYHLPARKKSGVTVAGKMLKQYFQRWTTTIRQVKGKHWVALESNLYLVSKLFCDPFLKLRLTFFILLPRSCKNN